AASGRSGELWACRAQFRGRPLVGDRRKKPFHFRWRWNHEARKGHGPRPAPRSPDCHSPDCPMAARGRRRGAGPWRPRRSLWRQSASGVHGERLSYHAPARGCGRRDVDMSASLVRATVRAVSKRKLQPTRAALTLVSQLGVRGRPGPRTSLKLPASRGRRHRASPARGRPFAAEVTAFWEKGHVGKQGAAEYGGSA
ncbi:iron-sulfur cluster assembly 1-like, mitochondrial, partial [Sigmodon hispidus]